jgi:hypothetical protein
MHLVQIFLPITDNRGNRLSRSLFSDVRRELLQRFGGLTAYNRMPVKGLWKDTDRVSRDELVIFEVMADRLERGWWEDYRRSMEKRFMQQQILMRAQKVDPL